VKGVIERRNGLDKAVSSATTMIGTLPTELVQHILTFCRPKDVAAFSQTCRKSYALIYESEDQFLWRELFLAVPFDDPTGSPDQDLGSSGDWKSELQARIRAETLVTLSYDDMRTRDHDLVSNAFDTLTTVLNSTSTDEPKNLRWLASTAARSFVFNDYDHFPRFLSNTQPLHQLLALSWDLWGLRMSKEGLGGRILEDARYFVYNLSKYSVNSNWGPFCWAGSEGRTPIFTANWEHIKHCVAILLLHGKEIELPPYGLRHAVAYSAPDSHLRASDDWAGVEGVWLRDVCFLDYTTLFGKPRIRCERFTSDRFSLRPQRACVSSNYSRPGCENYFSLLPMNMGISLPMVESSSKVIRVSK